MDESTEDPREYRGGVREPEEAKGGQENWADNEGVVPREMIDDTGPEPTGEQDLKDAAMGEVTDHDHAGEAIDESAGDDADATRDGGTGEDVEDLEAGKPISRVDQPNLRAQTEDVK
ncbi:MAG: hypothetical protein QOJ85_472 [Solirubrobacteraceae bacterium]|jgi:hypothetical protein|nr:hypothetical protein [Solirubrobacteraceae bacterium]MEA2243501.1 hypothetical protein [Solirubrobacteraceae bacterium]